MHFFAHYAGSDGNEYTHQFTASGWTEAAELAVGYGYYLFPVSAELVELKLA